MIEERSIAITLSSPVLFGTLEVEFLVFGQEVVMLVGAPLVVFIKKGSSVQ